MQDIHDLRCKNIIIINEYELQIPLISLFDRKNIDRGDLAQHFMPKNAVFTGFLVVSARLYKRVCPSDGPSVGRSVGPSVSPLVHGSVRLKRFLSVGKNEDGERLMPCIRPCLYLDWVYCSQLPQTASLTRPTFGQV